MSNEPLVTTAVVTAVIAALITLLKAFGVPITEDQQTAINQFLAVLAPLIVAGIGRMYVTSLASPRDTDGVPLSRPGDIPANKQMATLQGEAIEMNDSGVVTK